MAEPSIAVTGLRREFGSVTALDGVDLDLSGPGIVGLAGPNASGKTTLIRCLLGRLTPTAGSSAINGTASLALDPEDRRNIGYMPQREAIYEDLSPRENVGFFARLYGLDDPAAAIDRALDVVELTHRQDDPVRQLSGGMIRRSSLACAIVHEPQVLFLDEPTVGLDPELRASMWDTFRTWREAGSLILVSTHYLGEATRCDTVLFLRDGRPLAVDTPEAFLESTGTADLEAAFLDLLDDGRDAG